MTLDHNSTPAGPSLFASSVKNNESYILPTPTELPPNTHSAAATSRWPNSSSYPHTVNLALEISTLSDVQREMAADTVWDSNTLETCEMSKAAHNALSVLLDACRKKVGEMREQTRLGIEEFQTLLDDIMMRKLQGEDVRACIRHCRFY